MGVTSGRSGRRGGGPEEGFGVGDEDEVGAALKACSAKPMT